MKLQGRDLKPSLRGEDVKLLQSELHRLGFDVNNDGFFGSTTFLAVQTFQKQHGIDPANGIVDKRTAQLINEAVDELDVETRVVLGEVLQEDGHPVGRASVQAFIKGLRRDTLLGEGRTDQDGHYEIKYAQDSEHFCLLVRAVDGDSAELLTSATVPRPKPVEIVNLVVGEALRGPSEFAALKRSLTAILEREQVRPADLTADDIALLGCAHDLNPEHVAYFAVSERMAREADMSAEAFYALVRQGLPTILIALVAQPLPVLRRALETSVRQNIVGAHLGGEEAMAGILRDLQGQIVGLALREPEPDRTTFGALLDIAGVSHGHGRQLITAYLAHDGTTEEFWQQLRAQGSLQAEEIDALQETLRLATVTLNHAPLVRELMRMRRAGDIGSDLRALAQLIQAEWQALIAREVGGERIGAPAALGKDEALRTARYVEFLPRMVEAIFPTTVLAHRLAEIDRETFAPTIEFLRRNPEFEFRTMRLGDYLAEHPDALNGADDREGVLKQLKGVQRMFVIAPPFNKAPTVRQIADGIDSAIKIRRMGAPQYIRTKAEALGGVEVAQQVYSRAALRADIALFLASQSALFNPTPLRITAPHLLGEGMPDLEDLFGSLDLCQCEHCNAVYSPAAYLVDILHFLMNRPAKSPGRTALDVLYGRRGEGEDVRFDRRWDIGDIELTCHNTHTMLPYVDLVNEVLENTVAQGGSFPFQTEGDAEILGANPEHLNEEAYNTLADAVYPWSLPFDLWVAEARRYLEQLGVPRYALMEHFRREGTPPLPVDIAAEYLGMTPRERTIITGDAPEPTREMWGLEAAEFSRLLVDRSASTVLDRSGLSYEELTALLEVRLANQGGTLHVQFAGADCNLDTATINGLTTIVLGSMHRFIRLRRKLGWPIHELGRILTVLKANNLGDDTLLELARVKRLRDELRTPLDTILSWWSVRLDTQGHQGELALYKRVFLDPTVNRPELQIFNLNNAETQLANANEAIGAHAAAVHGALGISADDLERLVAELPDDRLNLANLTRLYQAASLPKALKLPIGDYVALRALTGIDPFGEGQAAATERFVGHTRLVHESGFSVAVLEYLLRHQMAPSSGVPDNEQIGEFLDKLRAALRQIAADHAFASDPTGEQTAAKLALLLPGEIVNRAMVLIDGSSTENQASQEAMIEEHFALFLDAAEAIEQLVDPGTLAEAEVAKRFDSVLKPLLAHLARTASESLVIESVAGVLNVDAGVADRLLRKLVPAPNDATQSSLDVFLDEEFIAVKGEEEQEEEEGEETAETPPTPDEFPDQFATFHRLAKVAIVLNALKIPAEHVEFFLTRATEMGWLDPNALPPEATESGAALFEVWAATVTLFRAVSGLLGGVAALFDLLIDLDEPELTRDAFLDLLAERTGWKARDLAFLSGPAGLDLQFPAHFSDGQFFARLNRCFGLLKLLGVSAAEAWGWAAPELGAATARTIKQAARARFDDQQQWLANTRPIRDGLREQQRAALVAFLVHAIRIEIGQFQTPHPTLSVGARRPAVKELQLKLNAAGARPPLKVDAIFGPATRAAVVAFQENHDLAPDGVVGSLTWAALDEVRGRLGGPNDLYAHFLVDVEMDPCMLTSRLVLATNAVQLFVQRCLLNLEPEVELTPEDTKEWAWMKNYRVWEANRKVFLYPENWIEPELRDDKTPFFRDLEQGLLQDEVNDATVEREYLKYLEHLDRVAQLEISGLYRQWETDRDILHVVARTRNTPHIYYYRRWVDQRYWTAWERVDADIEGDHLVPVVYNRRLYLFWPMFLEKAEETLPQGEDPEEPSRYYEIRLAWSEYRDGRWSSKRVSDVVANTLSRTGFTSEPFAEKDRFSFWAQFDEEKRLIIAFGLHTEDSTERPTVVTKQFRFAECNGSWELAPHSFMYWEILTPFPDTQGYFNSLKAKDSQGLTVFTAGEAVQIPFFKVLNADTIKKADVLIARHGFRLMLPNVERFFVSQSSFFYQDDKRTFFVVPRGGYTGGLGSGGPDDLTLELQPLDAVPLELPDIVTTLTANFVGRRRRRAVAGDPDDVAADDLHTPGSNNVIAIEPGTTHELATILAPVGSTAHAALPKQWEAKFFRFENFYHPYVCLLIEQLNRHGIDGILRPDPEKEPSARRALVEGLRRQQRSEAFFNAKYEPNDSNVVSVYKLTQEEKKTAGPVEEFDFSDAGAYSIYNWEFFFHAPFMIAKGLSANQRFAEAQRWFHYIFDPTYAPDPERTFDEPWPERVWQIKPFFDHGVGKSIQRTMLLLKSTGLSKSEQEERKQLRDQIDAWRKNPFNPHLIARMRVEAYMKAAVMAYLDNLIAWGDHLFRQDTRESINEATQLYILAAEILGERPREIPAHEGVRKTIDGVEVKTFNQLKGRLDDFSNVLTELETTIYPMDLDTGGGIGAIFTATDLALNTGSGDGLAPDLPLAAPGVEPPDDGGMVVDLPLATPIPAILGPTLFFCIPKNDKLLGYWDTVADRLFKIRHCMNIEGVVRQLALFQPPIDPGLLVKAAAAGLDIASVLSDLNAPLPHYRFQSLVQKANEFLGDVKNLGAALLSALEKQDAEELALLRSTHETQVLEEIQSTKESAVLEAQENKKALEETRKVTEAREEYYSTRKKTNEKEDLHLKKLESAFAWQTSSQVLELIAGALALIPRFDAGLSGAFGSPVVKVAIGGQELSTAVQVASRAMQLAASIETYLGNKASIEAGYDRRQDDWNHQADQASKELVQIDKQIDAAEIRIAIAQQDLQNHDLQIANAKAIDEYMRGKYTNQELYSWMVGQVSAVYFQSYQLAYDLAKHAERAFRHELGVVDTNFLQFGSWESLKKGLLAGERLQYALRRMEAAYLEQNRREYEITQHFSLALLNPRALLQLRETGGCEFEIPELAFDISYPGHYMRRIKSVGLTIPCVTGPYTNVSATLRLLKNRVRINGNSQQTYGEFSETNFRQDLVGVQSIVTSSAQNDSGLFQLNFQDERYLPFERAGAISRWKISLPGEASANLPPGSPGFRQFEYNTISDVILHMSYTARDGGDALKRVVNTHIAATIDNWLDELAKEGQGLFRLISLKHEFSSELHHLLFPASGESQATTLPISRRHFPYFLRGRELTVTRAELFIKPKEDQTVETGGLTLTLDGVQGATFATIPDLGGLPATAFGLNRVIAPLDAPLWALVVTGGTLDPERVNDLYLLLTYSVTPS